MYRIICFVLILSVSVANVSVRDCTSCGDENGYFRNVPAPEITRSIFTFGYHQGDILAMRIYIKNKALNVITKVYFTNNYFSGEKQEKELQEPNVGNYIRIRRLLSMRNFVIDVVLSTEKGVCFKKRIVEARDVSFLSAEISRKEYNDICLRSHWCEIEVNLENIICRGLSIVYETYKPRIRTPTTWRPSSYLETLHRNRSFYSTYPRGITSPHKGKDTVSTYKTTASDLDPSTSHDTDRQKKQTTTERQARDIDICKISTLAPNVSTSYSVTPTSSQENLETTSNKIITSETYAQTSTSSTNYLIIYSSIAAVAMILMILLVVIAIRTRCCVKHRPHGTPQLSTNENLYQMHQNLPLQKETEYEYESVYNEEHIYEEINYMSISK